MIEMFKSIIQTIKAGPGKAVVQTDNELELQIATCALLLEMAHADDAYTPGEGAHIADLMQQRFGLSQDAFEQIHDLADRRRREQVDLWGFTKTLKEHFSAGQKLHIMEMLWSVIYADDTLADYEDHLVHTLAKLLDIDHRDMIAAKVKVLNAQR
jgi:uncharacterized tellurite resistance protein B-like protein